MPTSLFPAADQQTRARLEQDPTLKLLNEYAWSDNALGPIATWPESLRGAVRAMMMATTPMVMLIGVDGILVYNNDYAVFAGSRHPEAFGLPATEAWPEIADFNREKIKMGLRGDGLVLRDQELVLDRHGGPQSAWMDLQYSPVLDESGQSLGTLCIVHETTMRVLALHALERSEERLSMALSGSSLVGTWDWDVLKDTVTSDHKFAAMFNLDPAEARQGVPISDFLNAVHPDDIPHVRQAIEAALRDGSAFRSEYRLVSTDGDVRWVVASGRPRLDVEGRPVRFPGVVVDVTEERRISHALAESELRFRTLADTMPQMVWSTLPDGYHDYYNARWYEFTGVPTGTTDGAGWNDMFHPDDRERARSVWHHSLQTGEPYEIEYRLRHHSGIYRWTLGLALPIRDAAGTIVRWIGTCTDINQTKLAAEERELVSQELSHRIKNIFAVLNGIISLTARSRPEIKPFADELRQRIYALGEAHNFIRPHSATSRVTTGEGSLKLLVERLMQPYLGLDDARLQIVGDDASINDGAATPLALLFHELATNAAKYGAFATPQGRVVLTGSQHGGTYRLTWKETGGPAPTGHKIVDGFGSRVIDLSVRGQLSGTIERFWDVDGLRVEISVPLSALHRSARLRTDGQV